jgi:hypothetical protein
MSITLLCLVKGNTLANAFPVHIDGNSLVGDLKDVIKVKKAPEFDNFPADKLKLWKVEIRDDHNDQLSNLTLQDNNELLATREIEEYWSEKPAKRSIHVIVEAPVSTSTSNEVLELKEKLASLQALLNKSVYGMYEVVEKAEWLCKNISNSVVALQHSTLSLVRNGLKQLSGP